MIDCLQPSRYLLSTLMALLWGLISSLTALDVTAAPPAPIAPIVTSAATRFTDNGNGTVTDGMTGLIWLKDANCFSGNWYTAQSLASGLSSGACGLSDGSIAGQWRLPNVNELQSLIDYTTVSPALPVDHPFTLLLSYFFWSATTYAPNPGDAWGVYLSNGYVNTIDKTDANFVWPVRGGL